MSNFVAILADVWRITLLTATCLTAAFCIVMFTVASLALCLNMGHEGRKVYAVAAVVYGVLSAIAIHFLRSEL